MAYFTAKDCRKAGKISTIKLAHGEFIRRFTLHILPKAFVRIRHYGILSSSIKKKIKTIVDSKIGCAPEILHEAIKHRAGFTCKVGNLVTIMTFDARWPPNSVLISKEVTVY